ncbi:hypothetical protein D1007_55854 [Hordeum vulgare]|nr:hypothetical protein D1007_55854 [Hordeum vulgare]
MVPLHIHALLSSVLPSFSSFLTAVISHYQIHAVHLDSDSLVLVSAFAFLCEAFVGVTPSVALLRHFFSLELVSEEQFSGCASLKAADASVPGALDPELLPEVEGFRRQWVQESRFRERHGHLKNEVDALRERLDQEVKRRQVALDAQATSEDKLSLLYKQVKGTTSLVGEASEEAIHALGLELERSRMFQSLERRASRALSDICRESVSSPLVPDDAGYLGFFLRVVECLQAGAEKVHALTEEKSRDLLGQAASDVLSHLLRLNPDFDFTAVLDPVPETIRAALAEWVKVHVEDLVTRLAPRVVA